MKTREEFEKEATQNLHQAINQAKQIRESLRKLEIEITSQEEKIRNYPDTFQQLEEQIVSIQSKLYAGGTT